MDFLLPRPFAPRKESSKCGTFAPTNKYSKQRKVQQLYVYGTFAVTTKLAGTDRVVPSCVMEIK